MWIIKWWWRTVFYLRLEKEVDKIVQFAFWEKSGEEDDREDELETDRAYDAQKSYNHV